MQFALVGTSGLFMDMLILYVMAEQLHIKIGISKLCSSEFALLNNFLWNEIWTFRGSHQRRIRSGWSHRLLGFHFICGFGILLAITLLHVLHFVLGIELFVANLLAILIVTVWNFFLNAAFNWRVEKNGPEVI